MTQANETGDGCSPESVKFPWVFASVFCGTLLGGAIFIILMMWLALSPADGMDHSYAWWLLAPILLFLLLVGLIVSIVLKGQTKKKTDHDAESVLGKNGSKPTTPPPPAPKGRTKINWGGIVFGTVILVLGTIAIHWMFYGDGREKFLYRQPSTALPLHHNFQPQRPCDVMNVQSYANKNLSSTHNTIKITLVEGCYADWYIIPGYFDQYETVLSHNPGDYVSLWCNGNPIPYPALESATDTQGLLKREMYGCSAPGQWTNEFHFQGHGTVTIIATSTRVSKRIGDDGYPAL